MSVDQQCNRQIDGQSYDNNSLCLTTDMY